ncbi:MAG: YabP/YqfC family sporulation protein [Sarcina sp.]
MSNKNSEFLRSAKKAVIAEPRIEITGKKEILIENHKGIINLDNNMVKLKTNIGNLILKGKNFNILFMDGPTIVVEGILDSLNYEQEV